MTDRLEEMAREFLGGNVQLVNQVQLTELLRQVQREALESAANLLDERARRLIAAREEQWTYEQEHGYSNPALRASYTSKAEEDTEAAQALREQVVVVKP
jgi:hypothetical protein